MATLTTLHLSSTDKNLLEAIKLKTGISSNAEVIRNLIRKEYFQVAKSNPKLAKQLTLSELKPGQSIWITTEATPFKKYSL